MFVAGRKYKNKIPPTNYSMVSMGGKNINPSIDAIGWEF